MNGRVLSCVKDKWNDVWYWKLKLEGNTKEYACWQKGVSFMEGQDIVFNEEMVKGRWRLSLIDREPQGAEVATPKRSGYVKSKEEIENQLKSFAMSYAKDMTVAEIGVNAAGEFDEKSYLFSLADQIYEWFHTTGSKYAS